ncbi:hypothetical protein [Microbacterium sp. P02]|uniref:hypothetical protein n=1 Tax=Microbacterium sp. P02 TaxID=3366260 RepID=UPI00366ECE3F
MAALTVDIDANTSQAVSQVKKLGGTFDDAALDMMKLVDAGKKIDKSNEDIARDISKAFGVPFDNAKRAVDKLDDGLKKIGVSGKDGSRDAESAMKDLERQAKDTDDAVDRIGDNGSASFGRLKDSGREAAGELKQNLGETFASFRGDLEDLPQIAQDTLGGLAGSGALGGIAGLAATAAGAAGLGLIIGAIQTANEETEMAKGRVADWAQSFIDAGGTMISSGVTAARIQDILTDPDKFAEAEQAQKDWGVSIETAVSALSGNKGAIDEVKSSLENLNQNIDAYGDKKTAPTQEEIDAYLEWNRQVGAGTASLQKLTGEMDAGSQRAKILSDANLDLINTTAGATVEVDNLGNRLFTLPDGVQILIDAATGVATQNVNNFKGDVDGIKETVTTTVRAVVDSSAIDAFRNRVQNEVFRLNVQAKAPAGIAWEG